MRRTLAAACVAGALLSGGAGVASATVATQPLPAATTTYVAQPDNSSSNNNDKSDKTGLWGLVGLLGLGGLAGLRRRKDTYPEAGLGRGTAPRA
ncbi:WGxxGxxG family protein [uncultured Mycolicibacterium sp.]|uniref:WGxxGxxG family protein n=1 Tax=uncultured Mycolicibacterium sp. TaxID=2320817 RepID=UPI0032B2918B